MLHNAWTKMPSYSSGAFFVTSQTYCLDMSSILRRWAVEYFHHVCDSIV